MILYFGIFISVLMIAGIILLSSHSPLKKRTRETFLSELERMLDSKVEPIEGMENCFQVKFSFKGLDFVYEDIEQDSFREKEHKAFLKLLTSSDFTLNFVEKENKLVTRSNLLMISEVPDDEIEEQQSVFLPETLRVFRVVTNNSYIASRFLDDPEVVRILNDFKNIDYRGYPLMTLKIIEGLIMLEFHTRAYINPNIESLQVNVHSMETYLQRLAHLYQVIEDIVEDFVDDD